MLGTLLVAQAELVARGVFTDIRAARDPAGDGGWALVETPAAAADAALVADVEWLPEPEEVYDCSIPGVHRLSLVSHSCGARPCPLF